MMNHQERMAVTEILAKLFDRYEGQYEQLMERMNSELVPVDFYELLYDILYEYSYDEIALLARVMKLLDEKTTSIRNKNMQNGYN